MAQWTVPSTAIKATSESQSQCKWMPLISMSFSLYPQYGSGTPGPFIRIRRRMKCICTVKTGAHLYALMILSAMASPILLKTCLLSAQLIKNWFWKTVREKKMSDSPTQGRCYAHVPLAKKWAPVQTENHKGKFTWISGKLLWWEELVPRCRCSAGCSESHGRRHCGWTPRGT